jgi:hypothetical protein
MMRPRNDWRAAWVHISSVMVASPPGTRCDRTSVFTLVSNKDVPHAPERDVCEDELAGNTIAAVDDIGRTVDDDDLGRRRHRFLGRGAPAGTQQNEPGTRALSVGTAREKPRAARGHCAVQELSSVH